MFQDPVRFLEFLFDISDKIDDIYRSYAVNKPVFERKPCIIGLQNPDFARANFTLKSLTCKFNSKCRDFNTKDANAWMGL